MSLDEEKKILGQFEKKDPQNILKSAIEIIDPNFDHPYCWHNIGDENLRRAKTIMEFYLEVKCQKKK